MERLLIAAVAALALLVRAWNLDANGWGAEYYSAAVWSMARSASNFLFAAFDPAGFISVDKPPLALWVQVASVEALGYRPWAVLAPQAMEGVGCVLLLYALVRRRFGAAAGLLAALFLALTPIVVAVNRTNNMDSALLLALMLAAGALLRAADEGRRGWLLAAMALVGVGFHVKMLAAWIVLPAFFATYALTAPVPWRRRAVDLVLAGVVVAAVSSVLIVVSALTPAQARPWVGGSAGNSMLELTVGHNALSRFVNRGKPRTAPGAIESSDDDLEPRAGRVAQRLFVRAPAGPARLLDAQMSAQASWLLPLALLAPIVLLRRDAPRSLSDPGARFVLFWIAWLATCVVVYSFAGGIVHFYYLATLAPALSALAAIGIVLAIRRAPSWAVAALLATAAWETYIQLSSLGWTLRTFTERLGDWRVTLTLAAGCIVALAALSIAASDRRRMAAAGVAVAASLALPLAWAASAVLVPAHGTLPSADLYRLDPAVIASGDRRITGSFGKLADVTALAAFLQRNRDGERFLLATTTTRYAAPLIIVTREPVMAMGGFHGLDGAVTPGDLERRVGEGEVRFVMLGDAAPPSRRLGADEALRALDEWVRAHGRRVPRERWRSDDLARTVALYDLRPERGWR